MLHCSAVSKGVVSHIFKLGFGGVAVSAHCTKCKLEIAEA
jgi:hypothetical protein